MLMEVKNTLKVMALSIKYNLMKAMLNKTSFLLNIVFMILNDATFIIQWLVIFSIKEDVAGYSLKDILMLWAIAAGTFGVAHTFFGAAFELNESITEGRLDPYLVQPKNVLLMSITSKVSVEAIGDIIYGLGIVIFTCTSISQIFVYILVSTLGGIMMTTFAVIINSITFFVPRSEGFVSALSSILVNGATYPPEIFKKGVQLILYTIIPVGMYCYMPHKLLLDFDLLKFTLLTIITIIYVALAFKIFYFGLKRYSSNNLMNPRV